MHMFLLCIGRFKMTLFIVNKQYIKYRYKYICFGRSLFFADCIFSCFSIPIPFHGFFLIFPIKPLRAFRRFWIVSIFLIILHDSVSPFCGCFGSNGLKRRMYKQRIRKRVNEQAYSLTTFQTHGRRLEAIAQLEPVIAH